MTLPTYTEPQVSFLVLDFQRPDSARVCLESIRRHVKLDCYKVIYCHNGAADYPLEFLKSGLIDELIMPRENIGLGLGTRALYAACFSPLAVYWQVDQIMGRDFTQQEVDALFFMLHTDIDPLVSRYCRERVYSVGLAGPVCGPNVYTERALATLTETYRDMERSLPLSPGGAGRYHHLPWREGQIQEHYRQNGYIHYTDWPPLAIDNGRDAVRTNPDGSVWRHLPDEKRLWLVSGPVKEPYVYPKLSEQEWRDVIATQSWPAGKIPEQEVKDSFTVPQWH